MLGYPYDVTVMHPPQCSNHNHNKTSVLTHSNLPDLSISARMHCPPLCKDGFKLDYTLHLTVDPTPTLGVTRNPKFTLKDLIVHPVMLVHPTAKDRDWFAWPLNTSLDKLGQNA